MRQDTLRSVSGILVTRTVPISGNLSGHRVDAKLPMTMDQVGSLCVLSGILWSNYGSMNRGEYMFYVPPECRWYKWTIYWWLLWIAHHLILFLHSSCFTIND